MHSLMKPIALVNPSHAHPYVVGMFFKFIGTTLLKLMELANAMHALMDLNQLPHGYANLFRHMHPALSNLVCAFSMHCLLPSASLLSLQM